jgi:hypothetical protein
MHILVLIFNTFLYNLCVATFSLNRPVTTCLHNLCVINLNQDNPIKYKIKKNINPKTLFIFEDIIVFNFFLLITNFKLQIKLKT